MEIEVVVSPVGFLSHDGVSTIRGLVWKAAETRGSARAHSAVRGVVQIVHGMAEHVQRYDECARYLVRRGYVVCAADHIGHGKSVEDVADLGHMPLDGKRILIEDVHQLRKTIAARYSRQTPYILLGHSMGSFIVRAYLARYGEGVAGAIICATAQQPYLLSRGGNIVANLLARLRGVTYCSALLDGLGAGSFAKKLDNLRTPYDWISTDPAVVDAYIADERCGTVFSVGGYAALTDLTGEVVTRRHAAKVAKDLPVLFIAGDQDPVGACGAGVRAAAEALRRAGVRKVEVKLYEGMRHEILNEPGRAQVYTDVADWIEEYACDQPTS